MSRDRSSANPVKLQQYATDGMALADVLLLEAIALTDAITAYNAAAGSHTHVQADLGELAGDLGGDWRHLDELAGDVAGSFRLAASIGGDTGDQVFTLPDSYLTQLGDTGRVLDHSRLVRRAELPADVLVRIGDHQLDDMLSGEGTSHMELQATNNILHAISGNEDASFQWSRRDGIREGTTNLELLREYRVHPQQGTRPHPRGPARHGDHGLRRRSTPPPRPPWCREGSRSRRSRAWTPTSSPTDPPGRAGPSRPTTRP